MKRKTTITLTIAGLLTIAGIVYAANPFNFSTFQQVTGVAVSKDELFTTGFVGNNGVYTLDCAGQPTLYQAAPDGEK